MNLCDHNSAPSSNTQGYMYLTGTIKCSAGAESINYTIIIPTAAKIYVVQWYRSVTLDKFVTSKALNIQ